MLIKELRQEIEKYLHASGMSPSAFGFKVLKDPQFVARLYRPRADVKASTIDKVRQYIKRHGS